MKETTITVTEYEESDYEALKDMSIEEIISRLEYIKNCLLPPFTYFDGVDTTEEAYARYANQMAMFKAIDILKGVMLC